MFGPAAASGLFVTAWPAHSNLNIIYTACKYCAGFGKTVWICWLSKIMLENYTRENICNNSKKQIEIVMLFDCCVDNELEFLPTNWYENNLLIGKWRFLFLSPHAVTMVTPPPGRDHIRWLNVDGGGCWRELCHVTSRHVTHVSPSHCHTTVTCPGRGANFLCATPWQFHWFTVHYNHRGFSKYIIL